MTRVLLRNSRTRYTNHRHTTTFYIALYTLSTHKPHASYIYRLQSVANLAPNLKYYISSFNKIDTHHKTQRTRSKNVILCGGHWSSKFLQILLMDTSSLRFTASLSVDPQCHFQSIIRTSQTLKAAHTGVSKSLLYRLFTNQIYFPRRLKPSLHRHNIF